MTKAAEYNRRYREKHPERYKADLANRRAKYQKKGRYRVSAEHKREVHRKNAAAWREQNRERVRATNNKSYKNNRATHQLYKRSYKAKKRAGSDRTIGTGSLREVLLKQHGRCPLCAKPLTEPTEIDHKLPISKGGKHTIENVQWVHRLCNRIKGNRYVLS